MKSEQELGSILSNHQLKSTTIRKSVLQLFYEFDYALSSKMIEEQLGSVDRVTLYRILNSFEESGIIHKVTNNTGVTFYARCQSCKHHEHEDDHAHFHCETCGNVYCLEDVHATDIGLPKNYKVNFINLSVYGLCDQCNHG